MADRSRGEDLRLHPARLARRPRDRGHADDPGDDPVRTPDHRVHAPRLHRRCAAGASTASSSCSRGWPSSTSSSPSSCSAPCTAWSSTATGTGPGWPDWCRARSRAGWGPVRRVALPAVAARLGGLLGARLRQQVGGGLPARGVQPARGGVVRGSPEVVRRDLAGAQGARRGRPVPAFVHLVLVGFVVYVATWTGWLMHSQPVRRVPVEHPVHPLRLRRLRLREAHRLRPLQALAHRAPAGRARPPGPVPGTELAGHYHRDVYVFHTHFLTGCTHTYASQPRGLAAPEPPRRRGRPDGHQAGHRRAVTRPPDSDCLRQVLLLGTPALWWGGILALLYAAVMWIGAPRLAVRGGRGRRRVDLAALVPLRRPADLQLLLDHHPAVPGPGAHAGDRQAARQLARAVRRGVPSAS